MSVELCVAGAAIQLCAGPTTQQSSSMAQWVVQMETVPLKHHHKVSGFSNCCERAYDVGLTKSFLSFN